MKKVIIMYTKDNCPNCNRAKFMLENCPADISLNIRNIEHNKDYYYECVNGLDSMTMPTIVIVGDVNEKDKVFKGWEENVGKIQDELGF